MHTLSTTHLLNIGYISDETNTCMYVHFVEFIPVDVVTLLYKDEVNVHWVYTGLYTNATIDMRRLSDVNTRKGDNCSW